MKKLLAVLLTFVLALGALTGCGSAEEASGEATAKETGKDAVYRTLDEIKESGIVKIGVFSDKNPFGYVDENGEYQGYDVYFAQRIAEDLGVVSPDDALITSADQLNGKKLIVTKGTTAETFFSENYPDIELIKFDQYTEAYNALLDGRGDAFSTDNTEVLAWALQNEGFSVGIESIGNLDTIAPAVSKGNESLLNWINEEIVSLADEQFFHADYEATLASVYGTAVDIDSLVVEGGVVEDSETSE